MIKNKFVFLNLSVSKDYLFALPAVENTEEFCSGLVLYALLHAITHDKEAAIAKVALEYMVTQGDEYSVRMLHYINRELEKKEEAAKKEEPIIPPRKIDEDAFLKALGIDSKKPKEV